MSEKTYKVDFFKQFKLETPIAGLVREITSPKGIRIKDGDDYAYKLHTELCCIYRGESVSLHPGIYQVLNICRPEETTIWNQYLFIIDPDGYAYPVAECLNCHNSLWIKEVLPIIKNYWNAGINTAIHLTRYKHEEKESRGWKMSKK